MTGRPAALSGPVVVVNVDGAIATWVDGEFAGDSRLLGAANLAALGQYEVEIAGRRYRANSYDPLGAVAALHAFKPWRTRIVEAPSEVLELLAPRELHLTAGETPQGDPPEVGLF